MKKQLPERPNLGQLKQQAKDLLKAVRAGSPEAEARVDAKGLTGFALHDAQRVLAREYGFPSWAKLKLHVETHELGLATARLVAAAAKGDTTTLKALLEQRPELARQTVSATAVLADLGGLREWIAKDPALATAKGGACDTEALGYVCLGKLGGDEAARVACADFLLAHGANPNATFRALDWHEPLPILYAATGRNDYPALARRMLAAGAKPNDGESIYHAAEHNHRECLAALLAAGGDIGASDAKWKNTPLYFLVGHAPTTPQAAVARQGMLWLLEHGANPNVTAGDHGENPLFGAIRNGWDLDLLAAFLQHGADSRARRADGKSALQVAVRCGRADVVSLLVKHGAANDATPEDRFLGAMASGDAATAGHLLAMNESWRHQLAGDVAGLLYAAAKRGAVAAIDVAGKLGFELDRPGDMGERALHWAAWHGQAEVVRRLVELGADLNQPDTNFHAPPLGWCCHGSLNCRSTTGNYGATAEALLAAGAATPPLRPDDGSPEVRAVFARFGKL